MAFRMTDGILGSRIREELELLRGPSGGWVGLEQFCSGSSSLTLVRYMERVVNGSLSDSDAPRSSPPISVQLLDGLLYGGTSTNAAQLSYSQLTVYVGKWADADSTNLADWRDTEAISRHIAGLPMPAPTTAGMCGVNSRESVKFGMNTLSTCTIPLTLPGISGWDFPEQLENPQSEITFARVNYKYATWTFSDQRGAANDPSTQQHFALQHSARFVGQEQEEQEVRRPSSDQEQEVRRPSRDWEQEVRRPSSDQEQEGAKGTTPEPPPIFPKLPSDIFYPFVSSAPSGREQLPGLLALTALATLLMSWQVL
eukprot:gene9385-11122_t